VIDRAARTPRVRVQRLAVRALGDEVRIALHAVDLAPAKQRQRLRAIDAVGAEFQAGGAGVQHDNGVGHGWLLCSLGKHAGRIAG
jgi:hypothetical protein